MDRIVVKESTPEYKKISDSSVYSSTRNKILEDVAAGIPLPEILKKFNLTEKTLANYLTELKRAGNVRKTEYDVWKVLNTERMIDNGSQWSTPHQTIEKSTYGKSLNIGVEEERRNDNVSQWSGKYKTIQEIYIYIANGHVSTTTTTNYYNDPSLYYHSMVCEITDHLEVFRKLLLEYQTILKGKNPIGACIVVFAYTHKYVFLSMIHRLFPAKKKWDISNILAKYHDIGLLIEVKDRNTIAKETELIERAIKNSSNTGIFHVSQLKYFALSEAGLFLAKTFEKGIMKVIPEDNRKGILKPETLYPPYRTRTQLRYEEEQKRKHEMQQERKEEEERIQQEYQSLIQGHEADFEKLRLSDFDPPISEKLKTLMIQLREKTGRSQKISDVKEAWRMYREKNLKNPNVP